MTDDKDLQDWSEEAERLRVQLVPYFLETMGMPDEVASEIFDALVKEARDAARTEKTDNWPDNFGNVLLHQEQVSPDVREAFAPKRAEGVTDEDIRLWWNLHDLERRLIVRVDEIHRMMLFESIVQREGLEEADAALAVARRVPIYGDPDFQGVGTPLDRPLPYELKWRVNKFLAGNPKERKGRRRKKAEAPSTINATVRRALAKGKL